MPEAVAYTVSALQAMAVDAVSAPELAQAAGALSFVIQYGDIRKLDREPLIPVLKQLFLRLCLVLPGECRCDDEAADRLIPAEWIRQARAAEPRLLDGQRLERTFREISERDDVNTRLSGLREPFSWKQERCQKPSCQQRCPGGCPGEFLPNWEPGGSRAFP